MDITSLLKTLPFLAPIAAVFMFWSQIQGIFHKIFNLFVIEVDLQNTACDAMCHLLLKDAKKVSFGYNTYMGFKEYLKPLKKNGVFAIKKTHGQPSVFWYKGNILYLSPTQGRDSKTDEYYETRMKIFFLRGTFDPDTLVEKALDGYNESFGKYSARFTINTITGLGNKSILDKDNNFARPINSESTNLYYFNKIIKYKLEDIGYGSKNKDEIPYVFSKDSEAILEDVKRWKKSEAWYKKRGILYRRGTLLYSGTGMGKSSAIRAVAQTLDLPVYVYDLASLSNMEFINAWNDMLSAVPCIAVFEDIDAVFEGRKNIVGESGGGLSFDCLLNAIGGTLPAEGVYTFITTNHVEKLDSALGVPDENGNSTRHGRLDNMIKMNHLSRECRIKIANKILEGTSIDKNQFINLEGEITAAAFVEMCSKAALDDYWKTNLDKL